LLEGVILVVITAAACAYMLNYDPDPVSSAKFEIWAGGDVYHCDHIQVDGMFVTLSDCDGWEWPIELVGGQDWERLEVEVNQ
jgi:hypothetical protein